MSGYKCPDCGSKMEYEGGLLWNEALTECFYRFKCPNCGSGFMHRLTKEEEDELNERARREKEEINKMTKKELLLKIFAGAKQRIRFRLLGFFILLLIAATFVIGIIEGSIRDAFFCLFALFLMFGCFCCIHYIWESYRREIKRQYGRMENRRKKE